MRNPARITQRIHCAGHKPLRGLRFSVVLAAILSCSSATLAPGPGATGENVTALRNVSVIDVRSGEVSSDQTVLIVGTKISRVGPSRAVRVPTGARNIDGRGKYLIPGLIDTHVHLFQPWLRQSPDTAVQLSWILASGVTTVREAIGLPPGSGQTLVSFRNAISAGRLIGPRLYLATVPRGDVLERLGTSDVAEAVRRYPELGIDAVKVRYSTRDSALTAIRAAVAVGIPVFGHTTEPMGENFTWQAVFAGINGIAHIYGMISPLRSDPLAPPTLPVGTPEGRRARQTYNRTAWQRVDQRDLRALIDTMVSRRIWFEPTLTVEHFPINGEQYDSTALARYYPWAMAYRVDSTTKAEFTARNAAAARFVKQFHDAGGIVVAGTDEMPFPPLGVTEEMRLLVSLAGLPPLAALQAATINAATALRWSDRVGTIEPGKLADLVLLDADPLQNITNVRRVAAVIANGRVFDRKTLDTLLARVGTPMRRR